MSKDKKASNARFSLFGKAFLYRPMFFVLAAVRCLVSAALPFLSIYAVRLIIDRLTADKDIKQLLIIAGIYCAAAFVLNITVAAAGLLGERYGDDFDRYFNRLLCEKAMRLDYADIENPEIIAHMEKAKSGIEGASGGIHGMTQSLLSAVSAVLTIIGVISIIAVNTPLLLPIAIIPSLLCALFTHRINRVNVEGRRALSERERLYRYIFVSLTEQKYGKDIRLYDSAELIESKADDYVEECVDGIMDDMAAERVKPTLSSTVLRASSQLAGYIYLGCLLVKSMLTFGSFSMLITSAGTLDTGITGLVDSIQQYCVQRAFVRDYVSFMELPTSRSVGCRTMEEQTRHRIEFHNVAFKYPRTDNYILRNISFTINSGERIAVVGQNGAGKTTLVKLLCGLYEPTEGTIVIDGIDSRYYDKQRFNELFSVVFQDFSLMAYGLGENIAIKQELTQDDRDKVSAIAERIGFTDKLKKFPHGIDTTIYKIFDDEGVEPSGGEQQKLAVARALYKDAPIIILDEPTAALDPIAENEVYSNFDSLIGDKAAVYISHRMSSTRFCSSIIVLENGRIVERGTHDRLMQNNGLYAKLFNSQAQFYN